MLSTFLLAFCTALHVRFSPSQARSILYRWRPLDDSALDVTYQRALAALDEERAFAIAGDDGFLSLYVFRGDPCANRLVAALHATGEGFEQAQAMRRLRAWHLLTYGSDFTSG